MNRPLRSEQVDIIRELVGDAVAQEDLPALERAYGDFKAAMDGLRDAMSHGSPAEALPLEKEAGR